MTPSLLALFPILLPLSLRNILIPPAHEASKTASDVETTRRIRLELMRTSLSMAAKNTKVLTFHGHVTLKGQVRNQEELRQVEKIAGQIAGPQLVTNEMTTPSLRNSQ